MARSVITFTAFYILSWMQNLHAEQCPVSSVWKRIVTQDVLISAYIGVHKVSTPEACGEMCLLTPTCKSFGISTIFHVEMECFLYKNFVWKSNVERKYDGLSYYWLQADKCPTEEGYKYNVSVNLCTKLINDHPSWGDFLDTCGSEGGFLAIVDSVEKHQNIADQHPGHLAGFIGGSNLSSEYYIWLDGSNVTNFVGSQSSSIQCLTLAGNMILQLECQSFVASALCEISVHQKS